MLCTVCLLFSIYMRYDLWLRWKISLKSLYTKHDNLSNTGILNYVLFEQLICIIAPLPFFDGITIVEEIMLFESQIEYELNDILLCFSFLRLYLVIRFMFYLSNFYNPRTQRVCQIYAVQFDAMFALKAVVKQQPFRCLSAHFRFQSWFLPTRCASSKCP
jgi:hypothetical protein